MSFSALITSSRGKSHSLGEQRRIRLQASKQASKEKHKRLREREKNRKEKRRLAPAFSGLPHKSHLWPDSRLVSLLADVSVGLSRSSDDLGFRRLRFGLIFSQIQRDLHGFIHVRIRIFIIFRDRIQSLHRRFTRTCQTLIYTLES